MSSIRKQWFPGFLRFPIKVFLLPFVWLDLFGQKVARWIIKPPFKQVGSCKKRGACCKTIMIRKSKMPKSLDLFWHTQINGFYEKEKKVQEYNGMKVYVMGCRYLQTDGSCGNYLLRPTLCRTWPRIEYFGEPQILKGCGFSAIRRE